MKNRLSVLAGQFYRLFRAASEDCGDRKYHGPIRVADIPFGALQILGVRSFLEVIFGVNRPVFGLWPFRTLATMRNAMLDCPTGLTARNDLRDQGGHWDQPINA